MRRALGLVLLALGGCVLDFPDEETSGFFPCETADDCFEGFECCDLTGIIGTTLCVPPGECPF